MDLASRRVYAIRSAGHLILTVYKTHLRLEVSTMNHGGEPE